MSCGRFGRAPGGRPFPALRKTPAITESLVVDAAVPLSVRATAAVASAIVSTTRQLLTDLKQGRRIDTALLRSAVEAAFGASDASGAWNWKLAYDACKAAAVLLLRRHRAAMAPRRSADALLDPLDHDAGHVAVIQIVSTGEALMEWRLVEAPREYIRCTSRYRARRWRLSCLPTTCSPSVFVRSASPLYRL